MKEYLRAQAWILIDPDTRIKVTALVVGVVGPALTTFLLEPSVGTLNRSNYRIHEGLGPDHH